MAKSRQVLGPRLEQLYEAYNREDAAADPIQIVRRYTSPADQEIVGFCAAALAFGRVASVLNTVETLARALGPEPATYLRRFDPKGPHPELRAMVHRWTRGVDIIALLWVLRQMVDRSGSIEGFFLEGYDPDATDIGEALDSFAPFSGGGDHDFTLRDFYAREMAGKRVLLADDVRNTGKTFQRCAELVRQTGGTVLATVEICDRMEAITDIGAPNYGLAEYKAPENFAAAECPMCKAGEPITSF